MHTSTLLAQVENPLLRGELTEGWNYLNITLQSFIDILFTVGLIVFIFIFIVGAFQWITAGGDKGKLENARREITHAIVGLLIMLFVFLLSQLLYAVLGLNTRTLG